MDIFTSGNCIILGQLLRCCLRNLALCFFIIMLVFTLLLDESKPRCFSTCVSYFVQFLFIVWIAL